MGLNCSTGQKKVEIAEAEEELPGKRQQTRRRSSTATFLKPKKMTLRNSWTVLEGVVSYRDVGVKTMFKLLEDPETRALFGFKDQPNSRLLDCQVFQRHAYSIIQAVSVTIYTLDHPRKVKKILNLIGSDHYGFPGFHRRFFLLFHEVFLHVWEREVGHQCTEDVRKVWRDLFEFMHRQLTKSEPRLRLPSASSESHSFTGGQQNIQEEAAEDNVSETEDADENSHKRTVEWSTQAPYD